MHNRNLQRRERVGELDFPTITLFVTPMSFCDIHSAKRKKQQHHFHVVTLKFDEGELNFYLALRSPKTYQREKFGGPSWEKNPADHAFVYIYGRTLPSTKTILIAQASHTKEQKRQI